MTRLVLDAGAFVAFEKGDSLLRARLAAARSLGLDLTTTAPVVAQVWRSGRQAMLARLLSATRVDAPDEQAARTAGELLAKTQTNDVVDALVVGLGRDGDTIITSDPRDIQRLVTAARVKVAVLAI